MKEPFAYGKVAVRVIVGSIGLLALGGPSPGHIGSCDGSAERTRYEDFCERLITFRCIRDYNGGMSYPDGSPPRLDGVGYGTCSRDIPMQCAGGSYGVCGDVPKSPTTSQTDACIAAMMDSTRNGTPESSLPECVFSCGGI